MNRRTSFRIALCILVLLILGRIFLFRTVRIEGTSMNNTLKSGDIALVTRLLGREIHRGDIVECEFPERDGTYVKRVIGLPGEMVEISGGSTRINGQAIRESYVSSEAKDYSVQLGENQYLLLGDNRAESYDCRAEDIGPADRSAILGKVSFGILPFGAID